MKAYIAGPMAGYYRFNFTAFDTARNRLHSLGHQAVSPADLDRADGFDEDTSYDLGGEKWSVAPAQRAWFLKRDISALVGCDSIVLLDGWEESLGANLELLVARACGMDVYRFHQESNLLRRSKVMPQIKLVQDHLHDVAGTGVVGL